LHNAGNAKDNLLNKYNEDEVTMSKILIIDGDDSIRKSLGVSLTEKGYDVEAAIKPVDMNRLDRAIAEAMKH